MTRPAVHHRVAAPAPAGARTERSLFRAWIKASVVDQIAPDLGRHLDQPQAVRVGVVGAIGVVGESGRPRSREGPSGAAALLGGPSPRRRFRAPITSRCRGPSSFFEPVNLALARAASTARARRSRRPGEPPRVRQGGYLRLLLQGTL